jgi:hypothetical protein
MALTIVARSTCGGRGPNGLLYEGRSAHVDADTPTGAVGGNSAPGHPSVRTGHGVAPGFRAGLQRPDAPNTSRTTDSNVGQSCGEPPVRRAVLSSGLRPGRLDRLCRPRLRPGDGYPVRPVVDGYDLADREVAPNVSLAGEVCDGGGGRRGRRAAARLRRPPTAALRWGSTTARRVHPGEVQPVVVPVRACSWSRRRWSRSCRCRLPADQGGERPRRRRQAASRRSRPARRHRR